MKAFTTCFFFLKKIQKYDLSEFSIYRFQVQHLTINSIVKPPENRKYILTGQLFLPKNKTKNPIFLLLILHYF